MTIYRDVLIFIAGFFVIIKGADLLTAGAENIAKAFRIPRIIIGLTIVSIATTAPEFTISTVSSYMKLEGMAVGNAVGSCILNIGLILSLAAIIRPINLEAKFIKQELIFFIASIIILYILVLDNKLNFGNGLFMLILLIVAFAYIIRRELKSRKIKQEEGSPNYNIKRDGIKFAIGAAGVVLSAKYAIIPSGVNIANFFKVPEIVIGLTIVALGTSLPELVTAIVASFKKMGEMAAGNVIGANILNILWVLGASSMINPLNIDNQTKIITLPILLAISLLMLVFSKTQLKLTRNEGLGLLAIYIGYIIYIFKFAYR